MSYETMVEQIKLVPQECLEEIENYIQFVLYRNTLSVKSNTNKNLSKYVGTVNFPKDGLFIQNAMRNEWN